MQLRERHTGRCRRALLAVGLLLAPLGVAEAAVFGGGGAPRSDCLGVFVAPVNSPAGNPRQVRCVDGEPCDEDGEVNGVCRFSVGYCANSTASPACSLAGVAEITVRHAADDGVDPDFDPQLQALQTQIDGAIAPPTADADECTVPTTIRVPVRGPRGDGLCSAGRTRIEVTTLSTAIDGRFWSDRDILRLACYPSRQPGGCDARTFFSSTFDRVQEQVFNASCATAVCHDSQSTAANLLLEAGASRANLIDVVPTNGAAADAGWRRITTTGPASADLATSFLWRKVTGDLPGDRYGLRMPRKRPRLDTTSLELLRIWIGSGAPDDSAGWLPGTD